MKQLVLILCLVFLSVASFAGNSPACSPTGTWYGGGVTKYILTITPITGERFAIRYEPVYSLVGLGKAAWTSVPGQLKRVEGNRYVGQAIIMSTTSSALPPPEDSYELDAVRSWMVFTNCDDIQLTYDFWGGYFGLNKVPFVDPPDVIYLPPGGFIETYHRMPTTCPACEQ